MTLLLVASCWLVLTLTGWLVLSPLDRARRDSLLPAAPIFGAVTFVVVLHDTTLLMSVRRGVWVMALVVLVVVAVAWRRDRTWWRPSREAVIALGLTAVCGALPAVWALSPSLAVGDSNVVQPSMNNDAYYYVTVAGWLQDHPVTDPPDVGTSPDEGLSPPAYATARSHIENNLRIGQELTHAALTTIVASDVEHTWYPLTALWVLLLPASGVAAALVFRLRLITGLMLGTLTSVSSVVIFQLAQQNSDSLMGTALLPLAIGVVVRAVGRDPLVPALWSGLPLAALIGTYTEFVPLIGLALVTSVLHRRASELLSSVRTALVVLAAAVALSPLIWIRAIKSLLFLGGISADNFPTAFAGVPAHLIVARFLGVVAFDGTDPPVLALVLSGSFVAAGIAAAVVLSRRRWFWLALLTPGLLLAVYFVTVRERPYTQQRVVQLLLPLVLLVVAVGWDAAWSVARDRRASSRRRRSIRRRPSPALAVAVVGALGATLFVVCNAVVDQQMHLSEVARSRHVGPEFAEAAAWVREVDDDQGSETAVLVGDFFSQLWITNALREEAALAYPSLFRSYQLTTSYWDGDPRRWLLTDATALRRVQAGVVVRHNSRFVLLDLSRGRAVVAVPADELGQNSWLVLRSESTPQTVELVGTARRRAPTDQPLASEFGQVLGPTVLGPDTHTLRLELSYGNALRVLLNSPNSIFVPRRIRFD